MFRRKKDKEKSQETKQLDIQAYLTAIGELLGQARQDLSGAHFITLLGFAKVFTESMYSMETKDQPPDAVDGLAKISARMVEDHLRQTGIES